MADYQKEEKADDQIVQVDYQMAIQNLTDILIDDEKFSEMMKNIYDAIDTDNEGVLPKVDVDQFTRNFLKGKQIEGQINTDFEHKHRKSFQILKDIESDYINTEELSKFMKEVMKRQVVELSASLEMQKHERAVEEQKIFDNMMQGKPPQ